MGRPVVLGHGFGGSARNFRPQARALADRYCVVLFDARGHARSEAPTNPAEYEPQAFVDDLARIVDGAGSEAAIVGGLSMGAGIALRYALAHPDRVRALVLAAFPPPGDRSANGFASRFASMIETEGVDRAIDEFLIGGQRFDREAALLIKQGFTEHPVHALVAILRRLLSVQPSIEEMKASLRRLDVPALVIVGAEDTPSLAPSRDLARALPRAKLAIIEGAGHVVNIQKAELFNSLMNDFLREIETAERGST